MNEALYQAGCRAGFEFRETGLGLRGNGLRPSPMTFALAGGDIDLRDAAACAAFELGVCHGHAEASRLDGPGWPEAIGHFMG